MQKVEQSRGNLLLLQGPENSEFTSDVFELLTARDGNVHEIVRESSMRWYSTILSK